MKLKIVGLGEALQLMQVLCYYYCRYIRTVFPNHYVPRERIRCAVEDYLVPPDWYS